VAKRIALIGSAPSSVRLAPYSDPDVEIWCCSPGAYPHVSVTRPQKWFEIHRWEPPWGPTGPKPWFTQDYINYLAKLKCPVYMLEPVKEIPSSVRFPWEPMLTKYGPYFWGSSLSWMMAMAIDEGATEIDFYGVDMSATEEWQDQRQGCHYFISIARALGIQVNVPPESDLFMPCPMYGIKEHDPMWIKLQTREQELSARIADAERRRIEAANAMTAAEREIAFLQGAKEQNTYTMKTWVTHPLQKQLAFENPPKRPEPTTVVEDIPPPLPNGKHPYDLHGIAE
jgi:hypothetical protein